ncbi:hypothetical protein ACFOYW_13215 [Gryllotalpicola reticulitermitis]|uniref:DUF1648 domain-containing protein n=1 Tax=Gryllotalpicola reticulitermitis TaxID=1184153 RepID=A0ABV8Q9M4_9MICO
MNGSAVRARLFLASIVAVLPVVGIVLPAIGLGARLGATIASHWSGSGPADGFASTWGAFRIFTGITVVVTIAAIVTAVLAARRSVPKTVPAVLTLVAGFTACAWTVAAWATADAATQADARLGARLLILLAAVACACLVDVLLPPGPTPRTPAGRRPALTADPQERISWTGVTGSRALAVIAAAVALAFIGSVVLALTLRQGGLWTAVILFAVLTALSIALVQVRITIDRRGIRLEPALLHAPLIRIRLENLASVTADTIEPTQWGGWGFRISGAGLAYVARRGPGLIITRRTGSAVAITVDQPEQPAAAANALIAQHVDNTGAR